MGGCLSEVCGCVNVCVFACMFERGWCVCECDCVCLHACLSEVCLFELVGLRVCVHV